MRSVDRRIIVPDSRRMAAGLKTDSGAMGPQKNAPALLGAGMMGDRADIIFASPGEISPFVAPKCAPAPR